MITHETTMAILRVAFTALCVWLVMRSYRRTIDDYRYQLDYTERRLAWWKRRARNAVGMLTEGQIRIIEGMEREP